MVRLFETLTGQHPLFYLCGGLFLFELIENPPKANPKLAQAMKQYKQDLK